MEDRQTETDGHGVPRAGGCRTWPLLGGGAAVGSPRLCPHPTPSASPLSPSPHPGASIYSVTLFLYWGESHKCPPPFAPLPPSPATVPPAFPPPEHPIAVGWGHRIPSVALGWQWALRMGMGGGGGECSLWDLPLLKSAVPTWGGGRGGGCACCVCGATALCLGRGQLWLYPPLLPAGLFWGGGDPNLLRPRAVLCLGGEGGGQSRSRVSGRGSWLLSAPSPPPPKAGGRTGPCSSPPPL